MLPGSLILVAFFLNFSLAETQVPEGKLCYILDGVLGMYGIILTILYCRLRDTGRYQKEEGIYVGLTQHGQDTYETIKVQKKAMLV
ncbi:Fc receptor, IgE, high affinity I, gamma polypeptide like isoform X2 [Esox lucius]|uniref:Fc receptor, IgE, high affinity I, gamma polypeptide like isoform X2 n=1 Tax=Esox lucius TaxID=8010 RepID=UPI000661ABE5|nr:Fc receptor, IgE, high affinity I, gamma polypeptide like isoform X2 [Esox lucius]